MRFTSRQTEIVEKMVLEDRPIELIAERVGVTVEEIVDLVEILDVPLDNYTSGMLSYQIDSEDRRKYLEKLVELGELGY